MKKIPLLYFLLMAALLSSCANSRNCTSKTEKKKLPVVSRLDDLPALGKAVYRAPNGTERVLNFKPKQERDDSEINYFPDNNTSLYAGSSSGIQSVKDPVTNQPCDAEGCPQHCQFDGSKRKEAKTVISGSNNTTYSSLNILFRDFVDHHPDSGMKSLVANNQARIAEENKNVTINSAYLFCFSKESDEDFHLVIGTKRNKNAANNRFFIVEISGLPHPGSTSYSALDLAHQNFFSLIGDTYCNGSGYFWFDNGNQPLRIKLKGSLYWDTEHWSTTHNAPYAHGPSEVQSRLTTVWEIHPVTFITER